MLFRSPDKFRHLPNWSVGKHYLFFKKTHKLPVLKVEDGVVYVFLDLRIRKEMIALIQHLDKLGVEFYFTHPDFSNPGEEWNEKQIIWHYFRCWSDSKFHKDCKKIEFDFVGNLSKWVKNYSDFELLKFAYDDYLKVVNKKWHNFYTNKEMFDYSEYIREEFRTLWREIQINNIMN